jgi:hypothetical protein
LLCYQEPEYKLECYIFHTLLQYVLLMP